MAEKGAPELTRVRKTLRMSEAEAATLAQLARELHTTEADAVRAMLDEHYGQQLTVPAATPELIEYNAQLDLIRKHLGAIGNNYNQIAAALNTILLEADMGLAGDTVQKLVDELKEYSDLVHDDVKTTRKIAREVVANGRD